MMKTMNAVWRKPSETTKFPEDGKYVYCYVQSVRPFEIPCVGVSVRNSIVPMIGNGTVTYWLDGIDPPTME